MSLLGMQNVAMDNNINETASIVTTLVNTLIDQVSTMPVVFDEQLLPKVLRSLSDSIQISPISRVAMTIFDNINDSNDMTFELFEVDPSVEEDPIIYRYRLSRKLENTRYIYVLQLIEER